jgi:3-oxoacyl-[acyl-carrier-protein] synthase II
MAHFCHDVWITGMGMVSAAGAGAAEHLAAVREGRSGITRHAFFNGHAPDPVFCGMIPESVLSQDLDAMAPDRADRVLELAVREALAQAGENRPKQLDLSVGTTLGNLHGGTRYYREKRERGEGDVSLVKHFLPCAPAAHVTRAAHLGGKRWTISSACGSGTAAIGLAFNRVRRGECAAMVAAGVDVLSPFVVAGFNSLRLVSQRACRPFDRDRDGLNPGEGAAALLLESAESARARGATPLAVVEGFGEALDAYHHTRSHPEGEGLVQAARKALAGASAKPDAIDHAHLHGTGTQANDQSEYHACRRLFGPRLPHVPVCSTKSMTGHTFGGAGALSAAFCVLSLMHGTVPATAFLENRDPEFEGLAVSSRPVEGLTLKRVLSLALGFGGEAFALVLRKE